MKALIVSYCPRGERSRTRQLAEHAARYLKAQRVQVDVLDLTKTVPDLFVPDRLSAYYRRNYLGEKITGKDAVLLKKMDQMTAQLAGADILVVAYPMYNFSQPAIVKAWFDSIMQKGRTWDFAQGGYAGMMKGKKALILSTSGGSYEGNMAYLEHSISLSKVLLEFMGYKARSVVGAGINRFPEKEEGILAAAKVQIDKILSGYIG